MRFDQRGYATSTASWRVEPWRWPIGERIAFQMGNPNARFTPVSCEAGMVFALISYDEETGAAVYSASKPFNPAAPTIPFRPITMHVTDAWKLAGFC